MSAEFDRRPQVGGTEGLDQPTPPSPGRWQVVEQCRRRTRARASGSTTRSPGAVLVDGPVLMRGGGSELAGVSRASTTRAVASNIRGSAERQSE